MMGVVGAQQGQGRQMTGVSGGYFSGMAAPPGAQGYPAVPEQKKVPFSLSYSLKLVSELAAVK
jgi:hypothetical protein